jgi:hypothetical protein
MTMTAKESREAYALQHDRGALQYYAEAARHAFHVAPIPEFSGVLALLETYAKEQTELNRRRLRGVYDRLRGEEYARRFTGYTVTGQYREALICIIGNVLAGLHSVNLSDTVCFAEAAYLAARDACGSRMEASRNADAAFRNEGDYHWDLWNRCFA